MSDVVVEPFHVDLSRACFLLAVPSLSFVDLGIKFVPKTDYDKGKPLMRPGASGHQSSAVLTKALVHRCMRHEKDSDQCDEH